MRDQPGEHGPRDVTRLLRRWRQGDSTAVSQIIQVLYPELRRLAQSYLSFERQEHTLQATALVHEAYMRLLGAREIDWKDRSHFKAVAAMSMRRVLVDHARKRRAAKRGENHKVQFDELKGGGEPAETHADVLDLDEALDQLAGSNERAARVVELKFFGGMSNEEMAEVLGTSVATVKRDWVNAKSWLRERLE